MRRHIGKGKSSGTYYYRKEGRYIGEAVAVSAVSAASAAAEPVRVSPLTKQQAEAFDHEAERRTNKGETR